MQAACQWYIATSRVAASVRY